MLRSILALVFGLSMATALIAAEPPTFEESLSMTGAWSTAISPDGEFIAYTLSEVDWEKNRYVRQIWVTDTSGERTFQLTYRKNSVGSPSWSPDGRFLSFTYSEDGPRQIYLISPRGGEAWRLSTGKPGVGGYRWSRDGETIYFTARKPESDDDEDEDDGAFFEVDDEGSSNALYAIDVPDEIGGDSVEPRLVYSNDDVRIGGGEISPDGKTFVFSGTTGPKFDWPTSDIYTYDLESEMLTRLTESVGPDSSPVWSPDGREIAFVTANGAENFFYTNTEIAVVPREGGQVRILTEAYDEKPRLVAWTSPHGILFSGLEKTGSHLYSLNPTSEVIERLTGPARGMYGGFSFTRDYERMALTGGDVDTYREIHVSRVRPFAPRKISDFGRCLEGKSIGSREVIAWDSKDGTRVEGILIKPADFDPERRYPLLCVIHGGPQGTDRPSISPDRIYPIERFLHKGALVLKVNYRGSAGYGSEFRKLNVRNLGVGDYWDVISGVDHLVEKGLVDENKVGCMGWSQGGYISAFVATYCNRFRAVSMGAGISDWITYYVNTDIHPFTRQYLLATPWDDPEVYAKTSPMTYLDRAETPTLIQHGELDRRVPIPNAYKMYQGLQDRGVPVKMFVFRGFGHGVNKPKEQRACLEQNYRWFSKWIWGEEFEESESPTSVSKKRVTL